MRAKFNAGMIAICRSAPLWRLVNDLEKAWLMQIAELSKRIGRRVATGISKQIPSYGVLWARRALAYLLCVALVLPLAPFGGLAWAQQLPSLGEDGALSAGAERRLGDRVMRSIYRDSDYLDDPVLQDYVLTLWQPLIAAARKRGEINAEIDERFAWKIFLVKDRSINAFALPGGYMGVHLGLMAAVAQPDELVSVLAHELSHVTQRHISRLMTQDSKQGPMLLAAILLGVLAARSNANALSAAIVAPQALALQNQLSFSRDMEREADRVGLGLMTEAGYSAEGMRRMFEKLDYANRINDKGSYPYLRSHPLTTERMAYVNARTQLDESNEARGPDAARNAALKADTQAQAAALHSMMAARARVLVDTSSGALRQHLNLANAVSATQALPQQLGLLYAGVMAANALKELEQAKRLLARLQSLLQTRVNAPTVLAAQTQQAFVQLALESAIVSQQSEQAKAWLALLPAAARSTLYLRGQAALSASAASAPSGVSAISPTEWSGLQDQLQLWLSGHADDAAVWELMAQVLAAQSLAVRAVRAQAEARIAHLDYAAGLDRLKAARDLSVQQKSDFFELSIIESRLKQIEVLQREQAREEAAGR
jgi:predicted Zn-dependent protease